MEKKQEAARPKAFVFDRAINQVRTLRLEIQLTIEKYKELIDLTDLYDDAIEQINAIKGTIGKDSSDLEGALADMDKAAREPK